MAFLSIRQIWIYQKIDEGQNMQLSNDQGHRDHNDVHNTTKKKIEYHEQH